MARLPERETADLAAMLDHALNLARASQGLTWDELAGRLDLDPAQLGRMRVGKEAFPTIRLLKLGPEMFGQFTAALLDEVGGWDQVLSRGLVALFEPFLASRGLARMAQARLASTEVEQKGQFHVA
jgi:hypothetical protein